MIASIFKKSKPINLIILAVILLIAYIFSISQLNLVDVSRDFIIKKIIGFLVLLFSVFLVDFIVKKNQLNGQHSYTVLVYTLLLLVFSKTYHNSEIAISNLFVLLALRRCISLKSQMDLKKKIFDATLWILVAALFNIWSLIFLIILIVSIVFYAANNYKNWLVPFVSFLIFSLIFQSTHILLYDGFYTPKWPDFSILSILENNNVFILVCLGIIAFWSILVFFASLGQKKIILKRSLILVFIIFISALLLNGIAENQELFMLFPISVLIGSLFQEIKKSIVSEIVTGILIVLAISNYFI